MGLLALAASTQAHAQATPTVVQVPANAPPPIPAGMKVTCLKGPNTLESAANCPVLKWFGYTYWAFSYIDNRNSMGIVTYDPTGKMVTQSEQRGARYVYAITVDAGGKKVSFAGQADAKITMTWDALFPPPVVASVPANAPPPVPPAMKVTCIQGPNTNTPAANCPVVQWGGYTYWAFSFIDNRSSMEIVAYDSAGKAVNMWERQGARYVYGITVDSAGRKVIFAGQADAKVTMGWAELFPPM